MVNVVKKNPGSNTRKGFTPVNAIVRRSLGVSLPKLVKSLHALAETKEENENYSVDCEIDVSVRENRECHPGDEKAQN